MVVSVQSTGQMCNRIVSFVQSLATAIDCGQNLIHFYTRDIRAFSDLHPEAIAGIKVKCLEMRRFVWFVECLTIVMCRLCKGLPRWYYATNARRCEKWRVQGRKRLLPIVHWFWYFRNDGAIVRHREKICAYLRAKDEHCNRPRSIVGGFRDGGGMARGQVLFLQRGIRTFHGKLPKFLPR